MYACNQRHTNVTGDTMGTVTIYHNAKCSKSREVLALIREAGIEPEIVPYLEQPPDRATLAQLIADMGISARELVRDNDARALGLDINGVNNTDKDYIGWMLEHPILINRPIVVTPRGSKLCRPPALVQDLLADITGVDT